MNSCFMYWLSFSERISTCHESKSFTKTYVLEVVIYFKRKNSFNQSSRLSYMILKMSCAKSASDAGLSCGYYERLCSRTSYQVLSLCVSKNCSFFLFIFIEIKNLFLKIRQWFT